VKTNESHGIACHRVSIKKKLERSGISVIARTVCRNIKRHRKLARIQGYVLIKDNSLGRAARASLATGLTHLKFRTVYGCACTRCIKRHHLSDSRSASLKTVEVNGPDSIGNTPPRQVASRKVSIHQLRLRSSNKRKENSANREF